MGAAVVGRDAELGAVDALLADARGGLRQLVLEGEPGIGKTTVWREGVSRAAGEGFRVLHCRAAQAESRLSFAGLGDLLGAVGEEALLGLPTPQRHGLEIALLRAEAVGRAPDPRTIGTGVASLVSALCADGPVLLALDDVQWLDRPTARALEFALRRLEDRPVAVLATVRLDAEESVLGLLSAIPEERARCCRLGPLTLAALYEILGERLGQPLSRPLLGSVERAARGNPFYALEIARAISDGGLPRAGGRLPVPDDVRDLVTRRLRGLPSSTRDALLRASAITHPTVSLLDPADLEAAVDAGVVSVKADGGVEFSHPLFAGAVYETAPHERRRDLHRELAEAVTDLEERARHLALAGGGPDEDVAAMLDRGADLAHHRGAPEVAAELAEQAAQRTPVAAADARWERSVRAAGHHLKAGDVSRAGALAEEVAAAAGPPERGQALHLLAEIRAVEGPQAAIPLLEEALTCVGEDTGRAARLEMSLGLLYLAVLDAAGADRHLGRAVELAETAQAPAILAEALAQRCVAQVFLGLGADEEVLERALSLEDPEREVPFQLCPSLNVAQVYEFIGRIDRARELLEGLRERFAERGEESDLPYVLVQLAGTATLAGDLEVAEREAGEALRLAKLTGQEIFYAFALTVRAMARAVRGEADGARADAQEGFSVSERIGWPAGVGQALWAQAVLALSKGDPRAAADALSPVADGIEALGVYEWPLAMSLPDAIEAFVATGDLERADRLTDALAESGARFDRPWALALSARCRALLMAADGDLGGAQETAQRAVLEHERLPMPFELARTLLSLGQIQRRSGERRVARETLQRSVSMFEEIGAQLWAEKAAAEVRRIGVRRAPAKLTENEERMAQLAAEGLTNPEIAAQMFVSRRTVESNLARAYRKLGINSRAELGATMARREDAEPA